MRDSIIYFGDSRNMAEVPDESIGLAVTSPPYWQIKNYGASAQIGHGQSLHEYLLDLARVWQECWRVLKKGRRLCINIGDQFARTRWYGRYKVIPLHAEIIAQCESIGYDYLGAIIWRKKTKMRTTGGAVIMGSFPYPPNGIVELDYEYILLFKKPGEEPPFDKSVKEKSKLTKEEWKLYFSGHWDFGGERQVHHQAMFPEELPRRLIRMFSFVGETVLDPFVGSGTTVKVAIELNRRGIGYEIQPNFESIIREKVGINGHSLWSFPLVIRYREKELPPAPLKCSYKPFVQDASPESSPEEVAPKEENALRVIEILSEKMVRTEDRKEVFLCGICVSLEKKQAALTYLQTYLLGKRVVLRLAHPPTSLEGPLLAYVYLPNKLFVNRKMIEMGLATADRETFHKYREKFIKAEEYVRRRRVEKGVDP
jgi:DNA modification methylase